MRYGLLQMDKIEVLEAEIESLHRHDRDYMDQMTKMSDLVLKVVEKSQLAHYIAGLAYALAPHAAEPDHVRSVVERFMGVEKEAPDDTGGSDATG